MLTELLTLMGEPTELTQDEAIERIAEVAALIESFELPRRVDRHWLRFLRQLEIERKLHRILRSNSISR